MILSVRYLNPRKLWEMEREKEETFLNVFFLPTALIGTERAFVWTCEKGKTELSQLFALGFSDEK